MKQPTEKKTSRMSCAVKNQNQVAIINIKEPYQPMFPIATPAEPFTQTSRNWIQGKNLSKLSRIIDK